MHLLLMSPKPPQHLHHTEKPLRWLPFFIDRSLASYRVTQCDAHGTIGKAGGHFTIVETPAAEPPQPDEV